MWSARALSWVWFAKGQGDTHGLLRDVDHDFLVSVDVVDVELSECKISSCQNSLAGPGGGGDGQVRRERERALTSDTSMSPFNRSPSVQPDGDRHPKANLQCQYVSGGCDEMDPTWEGGEGCATDRT